MTHALSGDIVGAPKIDDMHFGAVLHNAAGDDHIHLKPLDFPVPVHGLAIGPKRHGDEQRIDGKHHRVGSKEIAFVTAGRKAFIAAIQAARPIVLAPIADVEIQEPDAAMGDITGDLSARRGLVSGTANGKAGTMVVRGQVPMSERSGYPSRLNAMTSGQRRYTIDLSHDAAVPPSV